MSRRVHWLRTGLIALLGIALWLLLFVVGLMVALGSDSGTRWVLARIPGLEVQQGQGSLFGRWQAESLRWRGYGVSVDVASPLVDWTPACLLGLTLCLDELSASQTDVIVQPSADETEPKPFHLPALILPLDLDIKSVQLGPLTVNHNAIWDHASLETNGIGSTWIIHSLRYQLGDIDVSASGRVDTHGDWPLAIDVQVQLPPPEGDRLELELALSGSARDLRVRGSSQGYLDATFEGGVKPFEDNLPANLTLKAEHFLALDSLPQTLTLEHWQATLNGNLSDGFQTQSSASLPGTGGPIATHLTGVLTSSGVSGLSLAMTAPDAGQASLTGDLEWQRGFAAEADVQLQAFPWYQLIPDLEKPLVSLNHLQGHASYRDNQYQADLQAGVDGPLGESEIVGKLSGDLESVTVTEFMMKTGAGNAEGQGTLKFADQLTWDVNLTLNQFNPGYWVSQLEASLDGELASQGGVDAAGVLAVQTHWDLTGSWKSQDTSSQGMLSGDGESWEVSDFVLTVGDNQVTGEGKWQQQIDAVVTLDLVDPSYLLPGFAGQLQGRLEASGTPDQPQGHLTLTGMDLEWQDQVAVGQLSLLADMKENLTVDASLQAQDLNAGGQALDSIMARLTGNPEDHSLVVEAAQKALQTQLQFTGRWADGWFGALSSGEISLPEQNQVWELEAPATISYQPSTSLEVGKHCWRWQDSAVCAGDQTLWPDLAINYQLKDFPTEALAPVLPDTLRWQSQLDGSLVVTMTDQGPDGLVTLSASASSFDVLVEEEWHSIVYDVFNVSLGLKPDQADFEVNLSGPKIGQLATTMTLDPSQSDYPISGRFHIQGLDIAPLGAIADMEVMEGIISGDGTLSGPLKHPDINGQVVLSEARILDPRIPIPLEALTLELKLKGQSADIDGHWQSHEHSSGQLNGTLDWHDKPSLDLAISGKRLPFSYEPYASVELEPDLKLQYAEGELTISGELAVPRGSIEIRGLPEQAVTVSDDEVVVGRNVEEPLLRTLKMDVLVDVGADQVTFTGFGVTGDLVGKLRIGNNLDARGTLQLEDGNFKAFGQELELRRARLVFVGSLTEPYVDIEAIRQVDEVTAGLRLSGPASGPTTEVFSEPAMSQPNALSYVILGRPLQSEGDQGQVGQAAIALGLARTSGFTEKLGEELGIQQLTLETEGAGDEASVVASGYITNELSIRYGVGIFEPVTTVALRYDLGRYYYLEAASGLAASLDLFYTRDF